jgi:galactosylceramidase
MKRDTSLCDHSGSVVYNTTNQTATFQLDSSFAHVTQLFVFFSNLSTTDADQCFIYQGVITLNNSAFTIQLPVGVLVTLSTINGTKGTYGAPPASMPFPLPYEDDFDKYPVSWEAAYFADQTGSWEIVDTFSSRSRVMRQMVTEQPISWCGEAPYPFSVIGSSHWQQPLTVSVDVMIESVGTAFIALEVLRGACHASSVGSPAIVFSISATNNGIWQLSGSTAITNPLNYGNVTVTPGTWYTLRLSVLSDHSEAYINGKFVGQCNLNASSSNGLAAIGSSWNYVQFDRFRIQSP